VHEINPRAFGWSLSFYPDLYIALQTPVLAMAMAALAAIYPAWRSLRMDIGRELSRE
jgi:ABC-type lipoprotein release transport system permease subunit